MATAGMYDDSDKWLYSYAALPAKSGVGGGVIAVSPWQVGHCGDLAPAEPSRQ
jgi:glutaminase